MQCDYKVGQAIWGKIRFKDGAFPNYDRPYLIIRVYDEYISVLNISTTRGKEWKLTMPSNMEIVNYNPPFPKPSFVKLDSLQDVKMENIGAASLMCNGEMLCEAEIKKILSALSL